MTPREKARWARFAPDLHCAYFRPIAFLTACTLQSANRQVQPTSRDRCGIKTIWIKGSAFIFPREVVQYPNNWSACIFRKSFKRLSFRQFFNPINQNGEYQLLFFIFLERSRFREPAKVSQTTELADSASWATGWSLISQLSNFKPVAVSIMK